MVNGLFFLYLLPLTLYARFMLLAIFEVPEPDTTKYYKAFTLCSMRCALCVL
jgi:hypothetical protein